MLPCGPASLQRPTCRSLLTRLELAASTGGQTMRPPVPREMHHFVMLTPSEQRAAIMRMAAQKWSLEGISAATRLSVEAVRVIVGAPT